jgi:hypothetical protein
MTLLSKCLTKIYYSRPADLCAKFIDRSHVLSIINRDHHLGWTRLSLLLSANHVGAKEILDIKKTYDLAFKYHQGVLRKDGITPFIGHPAKTAMYLIAEFHVTDMVTIKAALLHDTLEDTRISEDEILKTAGEETLKLVRIVTKQKGEGQIAYLTKIVESKDKRADLLKVADRIANLRSFRNKKVRQLNPFFVLEYYKKTRDFFFKNFLEKIYIPDEERAFLIAKVLKELAVIEKLLS